MSAHRRIKTTIVLTTRRLNSPSGNPRFKLLTEQGVFYTETDAQVNSFISENFTGEHELTVNSAGKVIGVDGSPL